MTQKNLFKRAKMGQLPGDLSKQTKARMLESRQPFRVFSWQKIGAKCITGFRHDQQKRAKVKFNLRADRQMEEDLNAE